MNIFGHYFLLTIATGSDYPLYYILEEQYNQVILAMILKFDWFDDFLLYATSFM